MQYSVSSNHFNGCGVGSVENCSPKCLSVILLSVSYRILITNDIPFCLAGNKSQREELDSILFLFEVSFPKRGSSRGRGRSWTGCGRGAVAAGAAWAPRREQPGRASLGAAAAGAGVLCSGGVG